MRIFKAGLVAQSTAGPHTIFVVLQVTKKQMGQGVDTLCEETGWSLVAAWLLKSIILFPPGICLDGQ